MAIIKSKKNSKVSKLSKKKTMKRNSKKNFSRKMKGGMFKTARSKKPTSSTPPPRNYFGPVMKLPSEPNIYRQMMTRQTNPQPLIGIPRYVPGS